jgi:hypothetical protein
MCTHWDEGVAAGHRDRSPAAALRHQRSAPNGPALPCATATALRDGDRREESRIKRHISHVGHAVIH